MVMHNNDDYKIHTWKNKSVDRNYVTTMFTDKYNIP